MEMAYNLTLNNIVLKNKHHSQMIVTNRRSGIKLVANQIDEAYVFNQTFTLIEGRKQKLHLELLVSFVNESGVKYVGGTVVANRF